MTYLVIDIGGTYTKYALMSKEGDFLQKDKIPTVATSSDDFVANLVTLYQQFPSVEGIAISSAGVIDSDKGFMHNGGSLDFIKNLPLASRLEKACGVPVTIENDAKCAALAELWRGSLADCQNAIVMILGTAVGGAVIVDRKILKGKDLLAGEFSYILTDASDSMNGQKNLAIAGGVPALLASIAKIKNKKIEEISGELVFEWAKTGDADALAALRDYTHLLAVQIVNLHVILNPERFAIGGGISEQELFITLLREEIDRLIANYPFPVAKPDVVACQFHNDANLLGAMYVHLEAKNR